MYLNTNTVSINNTINRQLLEEVGMSTTYAQALADAITALNTAYRLFPVDARVALRSVENGTPVATIALALRAS